MSSDQTSAVSSSDAATASTSPYTATTALPTAATTTTTLPPTTSIVTADPSTSYAPAPTTAQAPTTVVTSITSIVTQSNTNVQTQGPIITTITSTQAVVTYTPPYTPSSSSSTSSSASASQSALSAPGQSKAANGGLSNGATIAIAVIIPILAVVGFVLFGLWFWRRRKAKKHAEEERKNDMAEYGFNPNNDPTLPVGAVYTDGGSEGNDDSGYRGWGTTSSANRKPSTTLGSNSRNAAGGQGLSETGSQPGGYNTYGSPSAGAASDEPLVHGYESAAAAGALGGAGAGAAMAGAPRSRHSGVSGVSGGINRGISNASSAYSHGRAHSEVSSDAHDVPRPYYQEEVPYNVYNENQTGHGQYNDGGYGGPAGDEPVIRDVQARRNTRIERVPTFPQQGQGGIATNF